MHNMYVPRYKEELRQSHGRIDELEALLREMERRYKSEIKSLSQQLYARDQALSKANAELLGLRQVGTHARRATSTTCGVLCTCMVCILSCALHARGRAAGQRGVREAARATRGAAARRAPRGAPPEPQPEPQP